MATAREIRRRIRSVKNVAQITRAVQMVASSKMRRAQERVVASRPYSDELMRLVARLAKQASEEEDLPLMKSRPVRRVGVVVISPDRGLAGGLPGNINRRVAQLATDLRREAGNSSLPISYVAVGRRGRDFLSRTQQPIIAEFTNLGDQPAQADVRAIARAVSDAYLNGDVDRVLLVYPKFISTVVQTPTVIQLLPVEPPEEADTGGPTPQYIYEPNAAEIFAALLPRYIETLIYQPLLENVASFYSAQMVAMKNATDNATDLVDDLTLTYNKARQTAITTQILEVVAGSNA
ncbi:MAG TPA: ATP synthase F1 subunit gamma [Ktedonobacterales bacterium]|jgi:F-type H+-transporting ATPase subunit gamma|nr:ATP synthase F1 subunit gamma [Ktedonobacterales bacterium]